MIDITERPLKVESVDLQITDVVLNVAVEALLAKGSANDDAPSRVLVTDDALLATPTSLLIVGESDLAASTAVRDVMEGKFGGACPRDSTHVVPQLVLALGAGCAGLPTVLVARARRAPILNNDLLTVLHLVPKGRTNPQIAAQRGCSLATVKRRSATCCF